MRGDDYASSWTAHVLGVVGCCDIAWRPQTNRHYAPMAKGYGRAYALDALLGGPPRVQSRFGPMSPRRLATSYVQ
jgi:hypothetical protein